MSDELEVNVELVIDESPTREEAKKMFSDRPDLAAVETTEGIMYRGEK